MVAMNHVFLLNPCKKDVALKSRKRKTTVYVVVYDISYISICVSSFSTVGLEETKTFRVSISHSWLEKKVLICIERYMSPAPIHPSGTRTVVTLQCQLIPLLLT